MQKYLYKHADPKHVKFQRIMLGWLAIAALFLRDVNLVWAFLAITALGLLGGTEYSLTTLLYKLFKTIFRHDLVQISSHHARYYEINTSMDLIDHLLRLGASSAALALYYGGFEIIAWGAISFLCVFMMLSAYFGFCLSALAYVTGMNIRQKFQKDLPKKMWTSRERVNTKCMLAKRSFTPYKRCDSCHVNIGQCLGTKFNSTVILIGLLMALFLFIDNAMFIQVNILLVMGLLFWLGYQINYSTDELAQSNDINIALNKQLTMHTESLEAEVKRRTTEIEHLATHDMLTGLLNRFSFEKIMIDALKDVDEKHSSHLAFIDLDKFKLINDTAGHLAGDKLLCDMSAMFKESVKDRGTVARLGGDEFAILFQDVTDQEALQCCQEICNNAGSYAFIWENETFRIGASIGLATLDATMQDIKAVIHHADQACYLAKKSGRNQVCTHDQLS